MRIRSAAHIRKDFRNRQLATGAQHCPPARYIVLATARHAAPNHFQVHLTHAAFPRLRRLLRRSRRTSCEIGVQLADGMREGHLENQATSPEKNKPTAV